MADKTEEEPMRKVPEKVKLRRNNIVHLVMKISRPQKIATSLRLQTSSKKNQKKHGQAKPTKVIPTRPTFSRNSRNQKKTSKRN
eukprot:scaffold177373_cov42-Attheya_sp.AAC.1